MAARSLASLIVTFGLVSIPVRLYSATQASGHISFNLLHKTCGSRLKQQYICAKEGVIVERSEMVKGYEFAKDQYVIFTPDELKAMEEAGTHAIEITEFVPAATVDPVYYDKAYYLGPDTRGAKPYALLAESMRQSGMTAIGRYAARGKQYIVQLRAVEGGIVMQQLLYAPEVRSIDEVEIEQAQVKDAELVLARQLIAQISSERFDPTQYKDEVRERIDVAIEQKVEGQEIKLAPAPAEPQGQVIDLVEALRASLAKAGKGLAKSAPANAPAAQAAEPGAPATAAPAAKPARKAAKKAAAPAPATPETRRRAAKG